MKTKQSVASIARQVLAILVVIMGVVTASVSGLHLPVAVSTALVIIGGSLVAVEHYLSDPSTGTAIVTTPVSPTQLTNLKASLDVLSEHLAGTTTTTTGGTING
jgi:hypothetical protein